VIALAHDLDHHDLAVYLQLDRGHGLAVTVTQVVTVRVGLAVVLAGAAAVVALAVGLALGTSGGGVQTAGATGGAL
jgi:hypothetical protein